MIMIEKDDGGIPHVTLGEVPVAYIVWAETPIDCELLLSHCRGRLAPYKIPFAVKAITAIPRTGSGKTIRFKLRENWVEEP